VRLVSIQDGFSIALDATKPPNTGYMVSPEKETEIKVPRNEVYFHHMSQVSRQTT